MKLGDLLVPVLGPLPPIPECRGVDDAANLPTDAWDYEIDLTGLAETVVYYAEPGDAWEYPRVLVDGDLNLEIDYELLDSIASGDYYPYNAE